MRIFSGGVDVRDCNYHVVDALVWVYWFFVARPGLDFNLFSVSVCEVVFRHFPSV